MIEINHLRLSFGSNEVLKGINLSIEKGQVTVIIGPSGSGKTTLLRCINLLEIPTEGSLRIGDSALSFRGGSKPGRGDTSCFSAENRHGFSIV
ncbi:ABC-type polar amino acid transport system ATPase subunit [Paenibacillus rhizosphaerae]|uniref:ABC-type polar amino acid transport system ATPase subunit n=1 Tax=Paenibacillus rhizosphaerae TaxID=297318 RepID=A0A839TM20_9BACL|nr:ABC-type polar amino acid transport system ATPase subunit [Paenibacillus rhizosphaerae]